MTNSLWVTMGRVCQSSSTASGLRVPAMTGRAYRSPLLWGSLWMVYALAALAYLGYQDAVAGLICGVA